MKAKKFKPITNYTAIDWTHISDVIDKATWTKLTEQFWLDTWVPVEKDKADWQALDDDHRWMISHVFGGLSLLDTIQSEQGMAALRQDCRNRQEQAVLNNIQFMETIHAKSYSTIFQALNTKEEIKKIFKWTDSEEYLQKKAVDIANIYMDPAEDPLHKKIANVFLETFLFYTGFYTPLRYLGEGKLTNIGEMTKMIVRDESVHGTYIGYKFQLGLKDLTEKQSQDMKDWMYNLLYDLYDEEEKYTHLLYDQIGWTDSVLTFIRYNANKALMNLGQDPLFPDTADDVNSTVMNGLNVSTPANDAVTYQGHAHNVDEFQGVPLTTNDVTTNDDDSGTDQEK